ncbi:MAG TPA: T9SS type A sorting domain-containing protein [Flavobacterium sp.]|nr:T9SS type A sorting domain-containing protein [Flavobacterium sp.]
MGKNFTFSIAVIFFSSFAVSAQTETALPPPPGCRLFYSIDINNDGFSAFDINYYLSTVKTAALTIGFNLNDYTLEMYPSEIDNSGGINQITINPYTNIVANSQYCSLRCIYSGVGPEYNQADLLYHFSCHILRTVAYNADDDNDGVLNEFEDRNGDLNLNDNDTDSDGIFDFMDSDDDGDGVLTVNEDNNHNGNYFDDDQNFNGIADFLDPGTTLGVAVNNQSDFRIYPNPASGIIDLDFGNDVPMQLSVYDTAGKLVMQMKPVESVDISGLQSGIYFMKVGFQEKVIIKKLIVL